MMTLKQSFISFLQSDEISGIGNFRQVDDKLTTFSYNRINFLYVYDSDDSSIFHLIVPKVEVYSEELKDKMIDFTMRYKIAKVIKVDDSVWFSFEQLVLNPKEGDYRLFKLAIKILSSLLLEWKGIAQNNENNPRAPMEVAQE